MEPQNIKQTPHNFNIGPVTCNAFWEILVPQKHLEFKEIYHAEEEFYCGATKWEFILIEEDE